MVKNIKSFINRIWKQEQAEPTPLPDAVILTDAELSFLQDMIIHNPVPRGLPPLKRQHAQNMYLSVYKKIVLGGGKHEV